MAEREVGGHLYCCRGWLVRIQKSEGDAPVFKALHTSLEDLALRQGINLTRQLQDAAEDDTLVLRQLLASTGGLAAFQAKPAGSMSMALHALEPALSNVRPRPYSLTASLMDQHHENCQCCWVSAETGSGPVRGGCKRSSMGRGQRRRRAAQPDQAGRDAPVLAALLRRRGAGLPGRLLGQLPHGPGQVLAHGHVACSVSQPHPLQLYKHTSACTVDMGMWSCSHMQAGWPLWS
jgi:hypothetical protein